MRWTRWIAADPREACTARPIVTSGGSWAPGDEIDRDVERAQQRERRAVGLLSGRDGRRRLSVALKMHDVAEHEHRPEQRIANLHDQRRQLIETTSDQVNHENLHDALRIVSTLS